MGVANTNDFLATPRINSTGEGAPAVFASLVGPDSLGLAPSATGVMQWLRIQGDPYHMVRNTYDGTQKYGYIRIMESGYYDVLGTANAIMSAANQLNGYLIATSNAAELNSTGFGNARVFGYSIVYYSSSADRMTITVPANCTYLKKDEYIGFYLQGGSGGTMTLLSQQEADSQFTVRLVQREQAPRNA